MDSRGDLIVDFEGNPDDQRNNRGPFDNDYTAGVQAVSGFGQGQGNRGQTPRGNYHRGNRGNRGGHYGRGRQDQGNRTDYQGNYRGKYDHEFCQVCR